MSGARRDARGAVSIDRALVLKAQEIPEHVVVDGIVGYLTMRRVEHTRTYTPRRFVRGDVLARNPQRGIPDVIGTLAWGQAFALEAKRPGGRVRESQATWMLRQPLTAILMVPEAAHEVVDLFEPLLVQWTKLERRTTDMWRWLVETREGEDAAWIAATKQARDQAGYRLHGVQFRKKLAGS